VNDSEPFQRDEHVDKPEWLKRLDGESSTTVVERTAVVDPAK